MNNIYFFADLYNITLLFIIFITGILIFISYFQKNNFILNMQDSLLFINRKNSLLIDIRSTDEYKISHISGSINIPAEKISSNNKIFITKKPIIFVCKNGNISKKLAILLQRQGIKIFIIDGGINLWVKNGLPLVQ
ncbi:Thiosulfate sulfurtransferase GlpE [Candidatus Kinetoplastibacterium sorsogonicusi]|uniref:Thiosulfate sulfurtransferase GlpE n=1 Tax=Candidatus Kinetoplastidibacterium kentomonadis TaxID=1576550 RepID=A0A3Q8EX94_9PROT|nr:rhodanese-like domain-containing protein [Candidatus Kinetoplastibacterium sorsogonicusi]AWD32710.1 Thiosulfate sulfurtransferase GlpE [Candidatus Kinetoplastibacterium sorsogonicusi]